MPLVSRKNALFIANEMPGMHVPPETLAYYEEGMSRSNMKKLPSVYPWRLPERCLRLLTVIIL